MAASYVLSRTRVPAMVQSLLRGEVDRTPAGFHRAFNRYFDRFRNAYINLLSASLEHRKLVAVCFLGLLIASGCLIPFIGTDFFPKVDAGQIRVHVRAPAGTRVEQTEVYFAQVEDTMRRAIPTEALSDIIH